MIAYFLIGCAFGAVFIEAEVISWFRIQEMFRFDAFHMFGIIGSAVVVAGLSLMVIKRLGLKNADGKTIGLAPKTIGSGVRYIVGGSMFGLGWALTGACPGTSIVQFGTGHTVALSTVAGIMAGIALYQHVHRRFFHWEVDTCG